MHDVDNVLHSTIRPHDIIIYNHKMLRLLGLMIINFYYFIIYHHYKNVYPTTSNMHVHMCITCSTLLERSGSGVELRTLD